MGNFEKKNVFCSLILLYVSLKQLHVFVPQLTCLYGYVCVFRRDFLYRFLTFMFATSVAYKTFSCSATSARTFVNNIKSRHL